MIRKLVPKESCLIGLFLMSGLYIQAQEVVVKINPLSLLVVTANIQGEYVINNKTSVQLGILVGKVGLSIGNTGLSQEIGYTWLGLTPEIRYYYQKMQREAPNGLYLATYMRYKLTKRSFLASVYDPGRKLYTSGTVTRTHHLFGGGVLLGYQWLFCDSFYLDLFFGPQYLSGPSTYLIECESCSGNESLVEEPKGVPLRGAGIRLGVTIGITI